MPRTRRSLSAPLRDVTQEIDRLLRVDAENQRNFALGAGRPGRGRLSNRQLYLLTEGLFFAGYRAFEGFLRDVFLLYCLEKQPSSGGAVRSFLKPKSFSHAERLIRSSLRFLDWTSPDDVVKRAEIYLDNGFPIKDQYAPRMEVLRDMKRIRNHIAHDSEDSRTEYIKVLRRHYGVVPIPLPSPGEYLLRTDRADTSKYMLVTYLEFLRAAAVALA